MDAINLMSEGRLIEQRRCACIMRWAVGLGAWAMVISVSCIAVLALSNIESDFESTRSAVVMRTSAAQSSAAESRAAIDAIGNRLAVSRAVRSRPDWSVLLPVVSAELGADIALEKIGLEPIRGAESTRRATLTLTGVGTDRAAVSGFVMRLEETGAFARVETASAQRRAIRDQDFFAFELHCRVGSGWDGGTP